MYGRGGGAARGNVSCTYRPTLLGSNVVHVLLAQLIKALLQRALLVRPACTAQGYQISQYDEPICSGGKLEVEVDGQMKRWVYVTRFFKH